MTIVPPQHLHTPGVILIRSKAICCHGCGGATSLTDFVPSAFLMVANERFFEALDKKP